MNNLSISPLDSLFTDRVGHLLSSQSDVRVDVWEDDDRVGVEIDLPGLSMEDVEVLVTDSEVEVKADRQLTEDNDVRYLKRGRRGAKVNKVVRFSYDLDPDEATATLTNGVLKVVVSKSGTSRPRRLTITSDKKELA